MAVNMAVVVRNRDKQELIPVGEVASSRLPYPHANDQRLNLRVVRYSADAGVVLDRDAMVVDEPYGFRMEDVPVVAVKRANGNIDIYHLPS